MRTNGHPIPKGAIGLNQANGKSHSQIRATLPLSADGGRGGQHLPAIPRDTFWPRARHLDRNGHVTAYSDPPIALPVKEEVVAIAERLVEEGHFYQAKN